MDVSAAQIITWSDGRKLPPIGIPREHWSDSDRTYVEREEQHALRVTGYLLDAAPQPDGDLHLYIGDAAESKLSSSFIAEMTPHFQKQNGWQLANIKSYRGTLVRITGWLLWDDQHDKGTERATSWEIHPITRFEVSDSSTWHPILMLSSQDEKN
jgi:hypothetical protein